MQAVQMPIVNGMLPSGAIRKGLSRGFFRYAAIKALALVLIAPMNTDPSWAALAIGGNKADDTEGPDSAILLARSRGGGYRGYRSGRNVSPSYRFTGSRSSRSYSYNRRRSYASTRRGTGYDRDGDGIPCERGCKGSGYSVITPAYAVNSTRRGNSYGRIGGSKWGKPSTVRPIYPSNLDIARPSTASSSDIRVTRAGGTATGAARRYGQTAYLGGREVQWNGTYWIPQLIPKPVVTNNYYRPSANSVVNDIPIDPRQGGINQQPQSQVIDMEANLWNEFCAPRPWYPECKTRSASSYTPVQRNTYR